VNTAGLLAAAAALLTVEALGALAFAGLAGPRRFPLALRLGASFALGLLVLALGLFFAALAGIRPQSWLALPLAALLAPFAALRARATPVPSALPAAPPEPRWSALDLALAAGIALFLAWALAGALLEPLAEWDVLAIWGLKARALLAEPLRIAPQLHAPELAYSHFDYPLLWPLAMSWIWAWCGEIDLTAVKLLGPAVLAAIAAALYGLVRERASRTVALLASFVACSLPMLVAQSVRLLADLPLGLFFLLTLGFLARARASDDPGALRLAAAAGGGLAWCKNEGLALLFAAALCLALPGLTPPRAARPRWLAARRFAAAAGLLAAPWLLFRLGLDSDYGSGGGFSLRLAVAQASRLVDLVSAAPRYLLAYDDWLFFWPVVALALLVAGRRDSGLRWLAAAVQAPLALYAIALVGNRWQLGDLLENVFSRLLVHFAPAECLLLALAVARSQAKN